MHVKMILRFEPKVGDHEELGGHVTISEYQTSLPICNGFANKIRYIKMDASAHLHDPRHGTLPILDGSKRSHGFDKKAGLSSTCIFNLLVD